MLNQCRALIFANQSCCQSYFSTRAVADHCKQPHSTYCFQQSYIVLHCNSVLEAGIYAGNLRVQGASLAGHHMPSYARCLFRKCLLQTRNCFHRGLHWVYYIAYQDAGNTCNYHRVLQVTVKWPRGQFKDVKHARKHSYTFCSTQTRECQSEEHNKRCTEQKLHIDMY